MGPALIQVRIRPMTEKLSLHGRPCWFQTIAKLDQFEPPPTNDFHASLIWDALGTWSPHDRSELGLRLVDAGARATVFGGMDCSSWDDDVGLSLVAREVIEGIEAPFVMSYWFPGEPVAEVLNSLCWITSNTDFGVELGMFREFVVVQVADSSEPTSRFKEAIAGVGSR